MVVVGALLGPEGTGPAAAAPLGVVVVGVVVSSGPFRVSHRSSSWRGRVGSWWSGVGLLVENCTVDASILQTAPSVSPLLVGVRGWVVCAVCCVGLLV